MNQREQFEAVITAPPFEKFIDRYGDDAAWPGQYIDYGVQLAWDIWQAAQSSMMEVKK